MLESLLALDTALWRATSVLPHPEWLTVLMAAASAAGTGAAIWLVLAGALAVRGHTFAAWRVCLALLMTFVVVDLILKPSIARPRPFVAQAGVELHPIVPRPQTSGFPSGHTAASAAGAYAVSRVWLPAAPALWTLAGAIAGSRLYLGLHYPLDLLAGLVVGLSCAYLVTGGMRYRQGSAQQTSKTLPAP